MSRAQAPMQRAYLHPCNMIPRGQVDSRDSVTAVLFNVHVHAFLAAITVAVIAILTLSIILRNAVRVCCEKSYKTSSGGL